MSKDKKPEEYYINIRGQKIAVTEEVYRAYRRPAWVEKKRRERENRCRTADGKRCNGNCEQCGKEPDGGILSLDKFLEEGCEAAEPTDVEELAMEKLLLDELYAALDELTDKERNLVESIYFKEQPMREYARQIGTNHTNVIRQHKRIIEKLRGILKKYS